MPTIRQATPSVKQDPRNLTLSSFPRFSLRLHHSRSVGSKPMLAKRAKAYEAVWHSQSQHKAALPDTSRAKKSLARRFYFHSQAEPSVSPSRKASPLPTQRASSARAPAATTKFLQLLGLAMSSPGKISQPAGAHWRSRGFFVGSSSERVVSQCLLT